METILTLLLCIVVAFIAGMLIFLAIRKIRKGWLIFWFLQGLLCPLLLVFGICFIEKACNPSSLGDRIEPYGILTFLILCQFVIAAIGHIRFVAAFLYRAKSRLTKMAAREKAEDWFLEPAW